MSKATHAILLHYSSTEDKPQHHCCPPGPDSWCSFQRDVALKTKTHRPIKDPLPPAVVKVIKPVFDKLGDKNFLAGCESCSTQNANESLHHIIWGIAPKDQFTSQVENNLAVNLGVLLFNCGVEVIYSQLLPMVDVPVTESMLQAFKTIDKKRIYGADYKDRCDVKERRKRYKRAKSKKADAFLHKEGVQYQSQLFYSKNEAGTTRMKNKQQSRKKGRVVKKRNTEK